MATFSDYQSRRKRRLVTVAIPVDPSVVSDLEEARRQLAQAEKRDRMSNSEPEAPALRDLVDELVDRAASDVMTFKFGELPRARWRAMQDEHPSEQPDSRYDAESLGPHLLAEAAADPPLTLADAKTIWTEWGNWAVNELFLAALDAQSRDARVPFTSPSSAETDGSPTS